MGVKLHKTFVTLMLISFVGVPLPVPSVAAQAQAVTMSVRNRQGATVTRLTDSDSIALEILLTEPVAHATTVEFALDDERLASGCIIGAAQRSCTTPVFPALGWYWDANSNPRPYRYLQALVDGAQRAVMTLAVAPRPVVLVHGFISDAETWAAYTGPRGYLAALGLTGYAVGDGQSVGVLRTGNITRPTERTNSIAENAGVLRRYIDGVKQRTGAQMVDVVAHSMGGLIARYTIDRLMPERDVAQLIMLGSPHGGSSCASLPVSLGWHLPAALELQPSYLRDVFNQEITRRHGVLFHQLAGTSISQSVSSPCTGTPSDLVVDRTSVASLGDRLVELPYLHTTLTGSAQVFDDFVAPRLRSRVADFAVAPALPLAVQAPSDAPSTQLLRTYSGRVAAGGVEVLTIDLDRVTVASFGLFDPTRSLRVTVRGANGQLINLDPLAHGYITVNDPASLVQIGYGFERPAPGPWQLRLHATERTPLEGAPYAVGVKVVGGATLDARLDRPLVNLHEPVVLTAQLRLLQQPLARTTLVAYVRGPNGTSEQIALRNLGVEQQAPWTPKQSGLHAVEVRARGIMADGMLIERTMLLTLEVRPAVVVPGWAVVALLVGVGLSLVTVRLRALRSSR